jgi:sec-independent protein translocase protein TatA
MNTSVLLFLNIGSSEMVLIVFVALLLFGGEKLPEIARGLGKGIRDFKDASEGIKREINDQINNYEKKEDKKTESAIVANQLAQPEPAASNGHLLDAHQGVPNTVPVNENYFSDQPNPIENGIVNTHETESHAETQHTGATEPVKNI